MAAPSPQSELPPADSGWRTRLHTIVFEADTVAGRAFDTAIIIMIAVSVLVVSLETVSGLSPEIHASLRATEWVLTVLFTIEYLLRLVAVRRPLAYAGSFYGVVDVLAILPTWISLIFPGARVLLVVRVLRLLRVFRVFKLARYLSEAQVIKTALHASARKITVFLLSVLTIVIVVGAVMYLVEGPSNGFTSIPKSMYWTIVTLTTVGYGDISPQTPIGQAIASLVMILGYGIIAVPTGIVTAELTHQGRMQDAGTDPSASPSTLRSRLNTKACAYCGADQHRTGARHCDRCGARL
jgi:voltage-gated potassium channel